MAYFSNSSEGSLFDYQCSICKYGDEPCPIAWVQLDNNYEACNDEVARKILDYLVTNDGECAMFKVFRKDLEVKEKEK